MGIRRVVPAAFVLLLLASVSYLAFVVFAWQVHMSSVAWFGLLLVLAVAEWAPVHNGQSRFRFRMAAQLPFVLSVGLFPVVLLQSILVIVVQAVWFIKIRSVQVYYPRIISSLAVPTVSAAVCEALMAGHFTRTSLSGLVVIAAIASYYVAALLCHMVPGPRRVIHPWKPVRGWMAALLCLDGLMAFGAILQIAASRQWGLFTVNLELAVMIGAVALYTDSSIRRTRLIELASIIQDLVGDTTVQTLVQHVFVTLQRILVFDVAAFWTVSADLKLHPTILNQVHEGDELAIALGKPNSGVPFGECLAGFTASSRDVIHVDSPKEKLVFACHVRRDLYRCAMAAPVIVNDELFGVLTLYSRTGESIYHRSELELMRIFCIHLGGIIANICRYQETRLQSESDDLTGLYNYRYFDSALHQSVEKSTKSGAPLSLLIVDIDHFKKVNDRYGHLAGNQVLCQLASTLCQMVRDADTVARYGGEEFTILLPGIGIQEARLIAERIRSCVEEMVFEVDDSLHESRPMSGDRPAVGLERSFSGNVDRLHRPSRHALKVTLSIGVASYPEDSDSALTLVRHADRAMYVGSKQRGRNRVSIYA